ncbi:MAG: hypothetical protein JXR63_11520 [Spirochaetales bacterium]|nr:hypothetical protein [Spirochaetales bacterium]
MIIKITVLLILFAAFIWALLFSAYYTSFLLLMSFFIITSPGKFPATNRTRFFLPLLLLSLLIAATYQKPVHEINKNLEILAEKNAQEMLTAKDRLGIYGLNLIMGIAAYPIYPEVAKETLYLAIKPQKNNLRHFKSNFAKNSEKIKTEINQLLIEVEKFKNWETHTKTARIFWSADDYNFNNPEARYALALNPAKLVLTMVNCEKHYKINVILEVKIEYPQSSCVTLISNPELKIEEGLFHTLQKEGWLFPYTAIWEFQIIRDKPQKSILSN